MHSSRSLRRPCLFVLSLSITLSFSPFVSSLSFSDPRSRFYQLSVSLSPRISLPLFPVLLSLSKRTVLPFLFPKLPSCSLSREHLFPPSRCSFLVEPSGPRRSASSYVHPLLPSLFFSSLCFVRRLSFPGLVHRSFFIALPGWSIAPSLALPHWGILFRRCLYIATGWYAGAYIIQRARVRVYVQEFVRSAHARKVASIRVYHCSRASFSGCRSSLGSAYKVTSRVRAALTVCEPVPLRVFEGNAEKWADVSFGGCQCAGTPTCATHVSSVRTRVYTYWVSGGSSFLSSLLSFRIGQR